MADDRTDADVQGKLDFWSQQLRSLPRLALPTDYPRPAKQNVIHAMKSLSLPAPVTKALARLALYEDESTSTAASRFQDDDEEGEGSEMRVYDLLLTALVVLIHRYTGDTDVVVASNDPKSGNAVVLRIKIEPEDSFWQVARRVQAVEAEALRNSVPFDLLEERIEADRFAVEGAAPGGVRAPLFRVRFLTILGRRCGSSCS